MHTRFTKLYTKLLSLPDNAKETFVAQLKETLHPLQGSTPSLTTSTHKTGENFTYRFVLGPLQSLSTDQNTHLTSKTAFWLCWLSRKIRHTPTQTDQNWAQFLIAQHTPYKTRYAFSQARDLFPQTYSVIAARIELTLCTRKWFVHYRLLTRKLILSVWGQSGKRCLGSPGQCQRADLCRQRVTRLD